MSLNRHMSVLRKFRKSKMRKSKSEHSSSNNYETLEPRQLLAIDFGVGSGLVDITTDNFGGSPNVSGGVGPNHIVQVQNGDFRVFDKVTGAELVNKGLDAFWTDTGNGAAVGAQADPSMVGGTKNSRVVYDADTRRWFIVSSSQGVDIITGTGAEGSQVPVLVAVSRTSDPTLDWQSMLDTYDHDNDIVNGMGNPPTAPQGRFGGFLPDRTRANNPAGWNLNLAVDDNNLLVTVDGIQTNLSKTYAFNKFALLVVPTPNSGAFFGQSVPGFEATSGFQQWNTEVKGVVAGTFGLETSSGITGGSSIILSELTNTASVHGALARPLVSIPVDPYEEPAIFIRQEFDPDIVNSTTSLISSPVRLGNSLWTAHTIKGSFDAQNPDGGIVQNSAIRWYEVDLDTKTIKQSGTIEHPWKNYIYPSIAVTEKGHVVISYTSTGVSPDGPSFGQFPSVAASVGYSINGVMTFEDPVVIKDGDGGYLDAIGNFWGTTLSTVADPNDPDKVWIFGQWSSGSSIVGNGQNQITEIKLLGHSPTLVGDTNDNIFVVRKSALDPTQIEVELDGVVIETYEEINLYEITLDGGGGGNDIFIVDTSNGEFVVPNGVTIVGDGDDQVIMNTTEKTNFEVFVDGSGTASVGTNVFAVCEDHSDVIQEFILNFEAGSGWFDATPYTGPLAYATQGEALRGELQKYFDEQMAPVFSNSFSIELDINDDETDSLASARALGVGLDDVSGQDLMVGSPWSILAGRGDRNADASDGEIDYNLDVSLYRDDFESLLQNIRGGLTRSQFFKILGMDSEIPNETNSFDPRGTRNFATVMDVGYFDLSDNPLIGNYSAGDSMFDVLAYQTNAIWAGDNTGIYFMGTDDMGNPMPLAVNSNAELIDFDTLASSLAGTSRAGAFNDIVEQDRAFLRGLGLSLNPVIPVEQLPGQPIRFSGIDMLSAGDGEDYFCIRSSNVDLEINGGAGNDFFNVTGLGVGALNLFGEAGDDTYQVVFSAAGVITIGDGVGTENDTLIGLGTANVDNFIFDVNGIKVNGGLLVYVGVENTSFDGLGNDDFFEIKEVYPGIAGLKGGDGIDTFIVSSGTGDTLTISVDDPGADPVDRLRLDITSAFTDSYTADEIESFQVQDGTFVIDGVNGTPSNAGGMNLIGDGDEVLRLESGLDASWVVDGDGAGNVTVEKPDPISFTGVGRIEASHGVDSFDIQNTGTDLLINAREGDDSILVNNSGLGVVTVNGNTGTDQFTVTNSGGGVTLSGNEASDTFTVNDFGSGVSLYSGNGGNDVFVVQHAERSVEMLGGDGNDRFTVSFGALGGVRADGQEGSDIYQYAVGSRNNRILFALDSGVVGSDRIVASLGDSHDNLSLVDESLTAQNDELRFNPNFESMVINAKRGNDVIDINRSSVGYLRILAGDGDDDVNILNSTGIGSIVIEAGSGFDDIRIDAGPASGRITAYGGEGDDSFLISPRAYASAVIDGQEGSDTYNVYFADQSSRWIVARDSGLGGRDTMSVFGSTQNDVLEFRSGVVRNSDQDILFTNSTEVMNLLAGDSNDTVTVYGVSSPTTNIMGQAGNDIVQINGTFGPAASKIVNVDGGVGNDNIVVTRTSADTETNLFGGDGDDNLTVGSSYAANNGNLDNVLGVVSASGGNGNDRVYINDAGKISSYKYQVGTNFVRNNGSGNNHFGGITFDESVEILRLDATNFKNEVLVTPNLNTKFSFFGNNGFNSIALTGDAADDGRQFFGQNGGVGFWTFSNGAKDIFFSNFLLG